MERPAITPYLAVSDGRAAVEWYGTVFGASVIDGEMYEEDNGKVGHASLRIGDGQLFVSDEYPELGAVAPSTLGGSTAAVVVQVPDVDECWEAALDAGATGQRPPSDQMGFRSCWFLDPWGHRWSPTGPERSGSD